MPKYTTNEEIEELINKFESAEIAREDWRHAEHLTVRSII